MKLFKQGGCKMKKVTGYASVRPPGCYDFEFFDFEFFVEDNATKEEIEREIDKQVQYCINYHIEEGFVAETQVIYRKRTDD